MWPSVLVHIRRPVLTSIDVQFFTFVHLISNNSDRTYDAVYLCTYILIQRYGSCACHHNHCPQWLRWLWFRYGAWRGRMHVDIQVVELLQTDRDRNNIVSGDDAPLLPHTSLPSPWLIMKRCKPLPTSQKHSWIKSVTKSSPSRGQHPPRISLFYDWHYRDGITGTDKNCHETMIPSKVYWWHIIWIFLCLGKILD